MSKKLLAIFKQRLRTFKNYFGVCVVIYGQHSPSWMSALSAEAKIWGLLPQVKRVIVDSAANATQLEITKQFSRTVYIPLMEPHIESCPRNVLACMPNKEALAILSNKLKFSAYVKQVGLASLCPATFASSDHAIFPCVLKRFDLNGGTGVVIVSSLQELELRLQEDPWKGQQSMLQQYVSGREFVTHCICNSGRVLWNCTYEYDCEELTIRGPSQTAMAQSVSTNPQALEAIESVIQALTFTGPCNVDYKIDQNGKVMILEINPRLGGSLLQPAHLSDLQAAMACILQSAVSGVSTLESKYNVHYKFYLKGKHGFFCFIDYLFVFLARIRGENLVSKISACDNQH